MRIEISDEKRGDRDRVVGPMALWMAMERVIMRQMRLFDIDVQVGLISLA